MDVVTPYERPWNFLAPVFKWTDIFHCNDVELKEITKEDYLGDALEKISRFGARFTFVTMGKNGLIARLPEAEIRMPAFKVKTIDPTGAGDAFCSGLMFKLFQILKSKADICTVSTEDWKEFLLYASACGAACTTAIGTTTSVKPDLVERIIDDQSRNVLKATTVKII
jgi:fructokinase